MVLVDDLELLICSVYTIHLNTIPNIYKFIKMSLITLLCFHDIN